MTLVKEKVLTRIPRAASAEEVGVSSKEVQAFIDDCEKENIKIHSLMVIRHGKVACEAYKDPYGPQYSHMAYSVSKSFTSAAVGFAVEEGYLTLETKFLDVFPYLRPAKYDPFLEKLNVLDLLTMRSGKSVSPLSDRTKDTWLKDFVDSPWVSEPGTQFKYISENMYVLCAMIKTVTGMSVTEFLTPRLYEPLGIETPPYWETCPRGIEAGGWGLFLTLEDQAKFTLCWQQMGMYNGKQVIPRHWIEVGTKALTNSSGDNIDSMYGYGYCFWRCSYEHAYRADGMFSQFGIVFEDKDAAFVMQGGNVDEQQTRDCIWKHFPKAFIEESAEEGINISFKPHKKLPAAPRSFLEKSLDGKTITFLKPHFINVIGMPVSVLPIAAVFMEKDKAGVINNIRFSFLEDRIIMTWSEGDEINTIPIGMDGDYLWGKIVLGGIAYNTASVGTWTSERVLEIHIRPIETVAERILIFRFKDGGKVVMEPSTDPSSSEMLDNIKSSVKGILPSELIANIAEKVIPLANPFADPTHYGKIN